MENTVPQNVCNQRRIVVPAPANTAFHFFTPLGEELWIDEWRPRYVYPPDGKATAGMVFTTGEGPEFTIWQLLEFDPGRRHSRYVRTTPASRTGTVSVQATPLDPGHAEILVRYDMTALHADAAASLEQYRDPAFGRMMDDWQARIRQRLPQLLEAFS